MKKMSITALILSLFTFTSLTSTPQVNAFEMASKNPKAGQSCAKKELGKKVKNLECKVEGTKYRWIVVEKK